MFFSFLKLVSLGFQICDMVAVARLLNLTLVVPELDKTSFWADNRYFFYSSMQSYFLLLQFCNINCTNSFCSTFEEIFDVKHFIDSLRDELQIVRRLPKRFNSKYGYRVFEMPPVSWSQEKYYLQQV